MNFKERLNYMYIMNFYAQFTNKVKYFDSIDEIINFSHKPFHKYHFGEADTHVLQFGWECLQVPNKKVT